MKFRKAVEENIAIALFSVAVASFGAGWISYSAVQQAAGLEAVPAYSLRGLEKRASLGKEDLIAENRLLDGHIDALEKRMAYIYMAILQNSHEDNLVKISNVRLDPPSPAKLKIDDTITIAFTYQVSKGEKLNLFATSDFRGLRFSPIVVTGSGEAKLRLTTLKRGEMNEIVILRSSTQTEITKMAESAQRESGHLTGRDEIELRHMVWPAFQMFVDYEIVERK